MRAGTGRGTKTIWKTIKLQELELECNSFSIQETQAMPAVMYKKGDDPETRKISTSQLEKHTWVRISVACFFQVFFFI